MNKNNIIIGVISVVFIFGFLFAVYALTNRPDDTKIYPEVQKVEADDHIKWSPAKKHLLVEYSDLQCPACKNYHDFLSKEIEASGSGMTDVVKNITFVYRHYPLTVIHNHALEAAYAAEAAGAQNKFFEMTDMMFDQQEKWEKESDVKAYFKKLAKDLKLDEKKFESDMESSKLQDQIEQDINTGNTVGVRGTPSFYLDGRKVEVTSFDEFKQLLKDTAKK